MKDLPQKINGYTVMAIARVPPRAGEVPDQFVVICDRGSDGDVLAPENQYVLWDVAFKYDEFRADNGFYDLSWEEAISVFDQRLKRRCRHRDWQN